MIGSIAACLLVLLALGLAERVARDRAWRDIPIRVHVNGTRGKSTVTRLIWSALREAGIPAVGKTTGTAARLLLPDGAERPLVRRAPASIREQLVLLRTARRLGARAVVAECMALDPELQWTAEHRMVHATVGVITNVREDHVEIMGRDRQDIAATLANTVPRGTVLVVGDESGLPVLEALARRQGSRFVRAAAAPPLPDDGAGIPDWLAENERTALAVTRELGIPDEVARRGFRAAPADPGAARDGTTLLEHGATRWFDATAANDPESFDQLAGAADLLVYNHRADRAVRLTCFADHSAVWASAPHILITGDRPAVLQRRHLTRRRDGRPVEFVPRRRLRSRIEAWARTRAPGERSPVSGPGHGATGPSGTAAPADATRAPIPPPRIVFGGNTKGLSVAELMEESRRHD